MLLQQLEGKRADTEQTAVAGPGCTAQNNCEFGGEGEGECAHL